MLNLRLSGLVLSLVLVSGTLFAQKTPILYMDNFRNLGKGNDSIGTILNRSLKLIVDLTRKYDVVFSGNMTEYLDRINMRNVDAAAVDFSYVRSNFVRLGVDETLVGTFKPYDNGNQVEIRVVVASLIDNKVKFDKTYRSATDADIFDAIDKIGLDLASVLVGRRLGVGMLIVNNTVKEADIFVNGVKSGKDRVVQNTAIAGLKHKVEIKNRDNRVLFSREFEIQDRGVYDLTYNYDEFVEFVDDRTNRQKVKKADYERRSSGGGLRHGPIATIGGGGFLWGGWFLDIDNLGLELVATFIPRLPNYMYDWYIGLGFYTRFYALQQESSWFNFYARLGILDYYGIELGFFDYHPFAYLGLGVQIMPDWGFMPGFMRSWKFFFEWGTIQSLGIFINNFAAIEPSTNAAMSPYKNVGWGMLSAGVRFPF